MGMFGNRSRSATYEAAGLDRPNLGGQVLNQIGMNLLGVDFEGQRVREALAKKRQDFMTGLEGQLGPQYSGGPQVDVTVPEAGQSRDVPQFQMPQRTGDGLNINSPELGKIALQAQRMGVPITQLLDVLKAQQPDVRYDRGYGYNGKTGAKMGGYHADLDKGIRPTDDGGAEVLHGYADAAASIEGAQTGAQEKAKAPYNFPTFTGPDGRPITVSAATAAALGSNGGVIAQGPSPAQTAADVDTAHAGAQANIDTPRTLGNAAQAVSLIEQMKTHAGLDSRTGWRSAIPAIPGTPGADFQAMADQLKGKVFLEAFGSLKGSGQITEVEGKKATDAIGRLSQQQTKEGYLKALQDLEDVINTGAARAAGQAQRLQPAASGGGSTPAAPKRPAVSSIPVADRLAEARRRGLIK